MVGSRGFYVGRPLSQTSLSESWACGFYNQTNIFLILTSPSPSNQEEKLGTENEVGVLTGELASRP